MVGAWTLQRIDPAFLAGLIPVLLILMVIYTVAPRVSDEDRNSRFDTVALVGIVTAIIFYDGLFVAGVRSTDPPALV